MGNYAVYYEGDLRTYTNSGDMGMKGWQLIGDVNQFIECSTYENQYKSNYPQIKTVLVFKKQIISSICDLPEDGALPVGVLFGKEIATMKGETKRFLCTDFVPQKYAPNKGYIYEEFASNEYKTLLASGLNFLGRYKVARGVVQKLTELDELLLKNLSSGQALCVIAGTAAGLQTAFIKIQNSPHLSIGVIIDTG